MDRVTEERDLNMGGWYAMIMDAGSDNASSATRVVRLFDRGEDVRGGVCRENRNREDSLNRQ